MEPRNRCQGINSASLCRLAGRYDNPIPSRCLAPIEFLKIPAQYTKVPQTLLNDRFMIQIRRINSIQDCTSAIRDELDKKQLYVTRVFQTASLNSNLLNYSLRMFFHNLEEIPNLRKNRTKNCNLNHYYK
jgi:hypothetical protein